MKDWLEALAIATLAALAPVKAAVITTGVLVLADLVVGVLAAHKRGEPITSAGLRRTIVKTLCYQGSVICAYITEVHLLDGTLPVTKIVTGLVGLTELRSIFESMDSINGKPIFAALIVKLGSKNDKPKGT